VMPSGVENLSVTSRASTEALCKVPSNIRCALLPLCTQVWSGKSVNLRRALKRRRRLVHGESPL
jgi:hypothetical protein